MPVSRRVRLLLGVTLVFAVVLGTDVVPWLRGSVPWMSRDEEWVWPYSAPRWPLVPLVILGLAVYLKGAAILLQKRRSRRGLLLWAYVGAVLLPLLALSLENSPLFLLFTRTASPLTGGYVFAAQLITDLGAALRHWPAFIANYRVATTLDHPSGVALSPPGLVALAEGVEGVFRAMPPLAEPFGAVARAQQCQNLSLMTWSQAEMASAWGQMAMPLWAALTVAPLYRLGALLFGRAQARWAVVLWPLVPGLAIFAPRYNTFFALLTAVMLLLLWRGLLHDRLRWMAAAGFITSVAVALNLALLPLGLLAGLMVTGYRLLVQRWQWGRLGRDLAVFGAASVSTWAVYGALGGTSPLTMGRFLLDQHYGLHRPYWPWLWQHPFDMAQFAGWPVMGLALWRVARLRPGRVTVGDVFAGAGVLTLLALVLSGTARGETGRVWLFFAPVWVLLAVDVLVTLPRRERWALIVGQAVCLLVLAAFLRANFTAYTRPPRVPQTDHPPAFPVQARFERGDERVTFVGLSVDAAPEAVTLYLHWRAESRIERPYVLALLSVAPDGTIGEGLTWNPLAWDYPPSCWSPEREFVDGVRVPVNAPGGWTFSLSMLDAVSHEPVPVTLPDGSTATQVGIGPVVVPPP